MDDILLDALNFRSVAQERSSAGCMINVYEGTVEGLLITVRPGEWGWKASTGSYFHETCYLGNAVKELILILIKNKLIVPNDKLISILEMKKNK